KDISIACAAGVCTAAVLARRPNDYSVPANRHRPPELVKWGRVCRLELLRLRPKAPAAHEHISGAFIESIRSVLTVVQRISRDDRIATDCYRRAEVIGCAGRGQLLWS